MEACEVVKLFVNKAIFAAEPKNAEIQVMVNLALRVLVYAD
jgi:hypothetical protein